MNYATSRHHRRLLGRLTRGENLIASLEHICKKERVSAGSIRAVGVLQKVELQTYEAGKGYQTTVQSEGTFELIELNGTISTLGDQVILNCYAHVGAQTLGGWQALGGRVFEASAISVEFVIDAADDVIMERRLEARLGLPILNRIETLTGESMMAKAPEPAAAAPAPTPEPAPPAPAPEPAVVNRPSAPKAIVPPASEPEPPKPAKPAPTAKPAKPATAFSSDGSSSTGAAPEVVRRPSWGDAIQYSKERTTEKKLGVKKPTAKDKSSANLDIVVDWKDQPEIKAGDLLEHPHFGLCKVIYLEEDNFIRVRKRNRKVVDIKLEVCEIEAAGTKDGKALFTCTIVRR